MRIRNLDKIIGKRIVCGEILWEVESVEDRGRGKYSFGVFGMGIQRNTPPSIAPHLNTHATVSYTVDMELLRKEDVYGNVVTLFHLRCGGLIQYGRGEDIRSVDGMVKQISKVLYDTMPQMGPKTP